MRPLFFVLALLSACLCSCKGPQFDFRTAYRFSYHQQPIIHQAQGVDSLQYKEPQLRFEEVNRSVWEPDGTTIEKVKRSSNSLASFDSQLLSSDSVIEEKPLAGRSDWAKDKNGNRVDTRALGKGAFFGSFATVLAIIGMVLGGMIGGAFAVGIIGIGFSFYAGVRGFKFDQLNRKHYKEIGVKRRFSPWPRIGFFTSLFWFIYFSLIGISALFFLIVSAFM